MPDFNNPPIHRHESLVPFSRDHYQGLVVARRLVLAGAPDAEPVDRRTALEEFVAAWKGEIAEHFEDEERLLLEHLADDDRDRLLTEHETLRTHASQADHLRREDDPDRDVVRRMGEALERHIRWEERELFTRLQNQLSMDQLQAIQQETAIIEARRPRNACRTRGSEG
jgi:hypothetical protein